MSSGPLSGNLPTPPNSQNSLADDGTAIISPSVGTKQPTHYQVIAESCEWCLKENPWTGDEEDDDDDDLIDKSPSGANSVTPPTTAQQPNPTAAVVPNLSGTASLLSPFGKMYSAGRKGKAGAMSTRKTLGARMI
jgi:hypothetical protein